jgi:DNA polymerase elongation subunit (family B)
MPNHISAYPEHLLILDIETVPQYSSFSELPELWKSLWADRVSKTMPENAEPGQMYEQRAGIHAEFGKIICISTGFFYKDKAGRPCFRLKSYQNPDEKKLLAGFLRNAGAFDRKKKGVQFAGHNIREFDIPYICRRLMIQQIPLPSFLQFSGKKPWETSLTDTMQLWKFGDYKNYTSLKLLAASLGIETTKNEMDGSQVRDIYYRENDLPRIAAYCRNDVIATAQILLRFLDLPLLPAQNIFVSD